jgi:hypothetical protein
MDPDRRPHPPHTAVCRKAGSGAVIRAAATALAIACALCALPAPGRTETGRPAAADTVAADTTGTGVRSVHARRINPHPPRIDGRLDDEVWKKADWVTGFRQSQPKEGEPARHESAVAIMYDDQAVYVGARLTSANPDNIVSTVSRRDQAGNSERIIVSLDTYNDNRTAYSFAVTATGTRVDYYHPSDSEGDRDYDWDPVWEAKTARTADGWSAEMRIPFTQLRFNGGEAQVWGANFNRWVPTDNEDSYWVLIPRDQNGWASRMGDLEGIEDIHPPRRVEFMPYAASEALVSDEPDPDDPFNPDGRIARWRLGGDFKLGLGPNFTLDGTINPDFGQVDADPAVVNLSAFEVFFPERRPFFTEGSQLLAGGGRGYFYSRRIGGPPNGEVDGDYIDAPHSTSILGAAKLTGRLDSGMSVGVLGAVTDKETATAYDASTGRASESTVEPLTGWGVVRLQQEFGANASTGGLILTGVQREINTPELDFLRTRAFSGGTDWKLRFNGGEYELDFNLGMSHIEGASSAIADAQTSSARFYQRPDVSYVNFDPNRTSLTGWAAELELEKEAGKWLWGVGGNAESPAFELNDIGQLNTADDIDTWAGVRYRDTTPGRVYQNWWTGLWAGTGWNFGRSRQYTFIDFEGSMTLKSFYGVWGSAEYYPGAQSDNLTRGGPSMGTATSWNFDLNVWSNSKGDFDWWAFGSYDGDELGGWDWYGEGGATFRPGSRWRLSLTPSFRHEVNPRQYVDTYEGTGGPQTYDNRYVFAFTDRTNIATQIRLNYAFTPEFTLELYAEPFASSAHYYDYGELEAARSMYLRTYGTDGTTITQQSDGSYVVTDGTDTFTIEPSDFNVVSFRSNLVLRWEYSPGSTLFLVWQQNRADDRDDGNPADLVRLMDSFAATGENFFAIKMTYWIPFF